MRWYTENFLALFKLNAKIAPVVTAEKIPPPKRPADPSVPQIPLPLRPGLSMVGVDEDQPNVPPPLRLFFALNHRCMPQSDATACWTDARAYGAWLKRYGNLLPAADVEWNDIESDAALWRWATHGMPAQRLERAGDDAEPKEKEGFVLRAEFMSKYEVRPPFEKFGGDAWFDAEGRPTRIRLHGQDVRPGEAGWERAKFVVRSSTAVWAAIADHFAEAHFTLVNQVALATAQHLPPTHPLRRLLKPFLFHTPGANDATVLLLFPKWGLLHRTFPFTWDGLQALLKDAFTPRPMVNLVDDLRRRRLHPEQLPAARDLAYFTESLGWWDVVERFSHTAIRESETLKGADTDPAVQAWWNALGADMTGSRSTSEALGDVIGQFIWMATAFHAQAQNAGTYLRDPAFFSARLVPGVNRANKEALHALCTLFCTAGLPTPMISGGIVSHMPDAGTRKAAAAFHEEVLALGRAMAARNAARKWPYRLLEPERVALSITV